MGREIERPQHGKELGQDFDQYYAGKNFSAPPFLSNYHNFTEAQCQTSCEIAQSSTQQFVGIAVELLLQSLDFTVNEKGVGWL